MRLSKSESDHTLVITPGEPAGIGMDVCLASDALLPDALKRIYLADPEALAARADLLGIKCALRVLSNPKDYAPGHLNVIPCDLGYTVQAGKLDTRSGPFVVQCLEKAISLWEADPKTALVTGPIQKSVVNQSGIAFSGHTEWLAERTQTDKVVMMLADGELRVALVTTHLPLSEVARAITPEVVRATIAQTLKSLREDFGIAKPRISICGLNPHAGEAGYLGREEIDIITPVIEDFQSRGHFVQGPLPADTAFTRQALQGVDAVIAMYHDQGLPVLKHSGFGHAVNVTLGLPIVRTSVDHGTALDLAGTGRADHGSLLAAIHLADRMVSS